MCLCILQIFLSPTMSQWFLNCRNEMLKKTDEFTALKKLEFQLGIICYCGNKWELWWNCGPQNRHDQHQTEDLLEIYLVRHHPRHTKLETPVVGSALRSPPGDSDPLSSFKQVVLKLLSEQWFSIYLILNGNSTSQEFIDRSSQLLKLSISIL